MNKYFGVFKTSFKQEKDTLFDTVMRAITFFIIMYIFLQLWGYIYGENGTSQVINGYSLAQMIWYLTIGELITFTAKHSQITRAISKEIISGSIAYKLNKPYNYYLYNITTFMAKSCFALIFMLPVAVLIGGVFVGFPSTFVVAQILPCIISILLSHLLNWCLFAIVGLLGFWCQDASPFDWIVSKFLMLLGMFFPIEFFPSWLQPAIRYSPIYSIMSGPASLVANFSWELFGQVILSQIVWIVILILIGLGLYNIGKRKVVSNGG